MKSIISVGIYILFLNQFINAKIFEINFEKGLYPISRFGVEYKTSFYDIENFSVGINTLMIEKIKDMDVKKLIKINKRNDYGIDGWGFGYGVFTKFNMTNQLLLEINTWVNFNNEIKAFNRNSIGFYIYPKQNIGFFIREDYDVKFNKDMINNFNTSIGISIRGDVMKRENKILANIIPVIPIFVLGVGLLLLYIALSNACFDCGDHGDE